MTYQEDHYPSVVLHHPHLHHPARPIGYGKTKTQFHYFDLGNLSDVSHYHLDKALAYH